MDAFADIPGGPINAKDQGYREGYKAGQQNPSPEARAKIEAETLRKAAQTSYEHKHESDGGFCNCKVNIGMAIEALIPKEER